jgi:carbonic anhydrase/acetyltransferase-like protein (isoleucine patch superfamily)
MGAGVGVPDGVTAGMALGVDPSTAGRIEPGSGAAATAGIAPGVTAGVAVGVTVADALGIVAEAGVGITGPVAVGAGANARVAAAPRSGLTPASTGSAPTTESGSSVLSPVASACPDTGQTTTNAATTASVRSIVVANIARLAQRPTMSIESFAGTTPKLHPTAWVHPGAHLLGDVELGEEVSVWPMTVLRGDSGWIHVGARSNLQDGTICHATTDLSNTTVGADVTVGHRVILHGCSVGASCLIGMGSILLDGVELGDWCFVAAGSLLTPGKRYEPRSFILGSPAKRVREVSTQEVEAIVHGARAYLELARRHRLGR